MILFSYLCKEIKHLNEQYFVRMNYSVSSKLHSVYDI